MYKFKFDPPQEHRRSLQTHKNEHVPLINTLEKCTQILREDRLWLRNQIKNNNAQLLNLFKQFPRSTQLQHLQIKLRKFVQTVKSKIKQEQLNKFRETLNSQNLSAFHNRSQVPMSQSKKQSQSKALNTSHSRQHLKSNSSMELNKTTQFRPHKSQEPKQPSQMTMTTSLRHFQELLKYKCNQQVIEERQSQNVTSARLARQENQQQSRPLQQLAYSSNNNKSKPIQKNFLKERNDDMAYNFRAKPYVHNSNEKLNSWQFQQMAKRTLYQYQPKLQAQDKERKRQIEDSNYGDCSGINRESQQAQESIMDKHFIDESQKISPRREIIQSMNNKGLDVKYSNNFNRENTNYHEQSENTKNQDNKFSPKHKSTFQLKQSLFSTLNQNKIKQVTQNLPDIDTNNEQNLFTPLQLLNECRNFLRSRQNSTTKANEVQPHFQETFKPNQLGQLHSECLFTRNNFQENILQSKQIKQKAQEKQQRSEIKEEESAFMFPQIKSPQDKINNQSNRQDESVVSYPHFQTFANASNQKNTFQKALNPPQYVRPNSIGNKMQTKSEQQSSIPINFSIEDLIEDLMQQTEMNPFISITHLNQYIATHSLSRMLSRVLNQLSKQGKDEETCLTKIAEMINLAYNDEHQDSYPHTDNKINAVYDLLDIDHKGYISREDVDSFLNQIEQAQVDNFDEVSEEILRLFNGADFTNEQRLTYWHLYIVKNSEEFESVSQLLGEFQFEIEREF